MNISRSWNVWNVWNGLIACVCAGMVLGACGTLHGNDGDGSQAAADSRTVSSAGSTGDTSAGASPAGTASSSPSNNSGATAAASGLPSTPETSAGNASNASDASTRQGLGSHGVAQRVEMVPRSPGLGVGASVAGAAVGGTVAGIVAGNEGKDDSGGSTSPNDMVYRIVVRFDDGSTRSMMQESGAAIQNGDRVHVDNNGTLTRD